MNASWGVTGSPGKFVYPAANRVKCDTEKLYEAMKMIMGGSSLGAAAIAISVANENWRVGRWCRRTTSLCVERQQIQIDPI